MRMIKSVVLSMLVSWPSRSPKGARVRKTDLMLPRLRAHGMTVAARVGKYLRRSVEVKQ